MTAQIVGNAGIYPVLYSSDADFRTTAGAVYGKYDVPGQLWERVAEGRVQFHLLTAAIADTYADLQQYPATYGLTSIDDE